MYQIKHITDKEGVAKAEPSGRAHLGCIGEAKMEDGCVQIGRASCRERVCLYV